ncbi:MAG: serine/threonine-protein kinase [Myxococcales bacterium]
MSDAASPPSESGPGAIPSTRNDGSDSGGFTASESSQMLSQSREADQEEDPEHTAVAGGVKLRQSAPVGAGTVLAQRYQIEAALGEGGSGTVYRAWDRILGDLVAVKILHAQRAREKSWIKRLAREVKVARAIGHPNVCRVFELGNADGHWFVTMELATSGSLRDMLRDGTKATARPLPDRLRDIRELSAGLAAMHAVAITHRDVTPQNVLRMADGRLVLTDFGLAIESGDQTTVHGGTPAYLPPEAARGERSDLRSDVFQLGMIMHEVMTGVRATWSPDGARLMLIEPATGAAAVEDELFRLITDCLNTDPARRPPSAVAVAGRLAAAEVARAAPLGRRMVARARRYARRHRRLVTTMAATLVLAGLVRTVQVVSRPPLCLGGTQQMAGIWDGARAEAMRRSFVSSGKGYAAESFTRVRVILDSYAAAWTGMYKDACEATHVRGEQSAEVLDLRMACLKDGQGELRALTDLFSVADGEVVSRAINAASALSPVARCSDVRVLRAVMRPPNDPATRAKVEALRQRLSEVKALQGAGRVVEADRRAPPLVTAARTIAYDPLLAEALDTLGRGKLLSGPFEVGESALDEAMLVAEGSRHDRMLAEAAVDKVSLLGTNGKVDELIHFVPRAESILKRIGGDDLLEGWIYAGMGQAMLLNGRFSEALDAHRKALQYKLRVLPPEHWDVALSIGNVASALHSVGREQEALEQNEKAIALLKRAFGEQHPELAIHTYNRGEIRLALGDVAEAQVDFKRALEIWRGELAPDHLYNSYPLTGMGLAMLAAGHAGEAVAPLERALNIRQKAQAAPEMRAATMLALARALWLAGPRGESDKERARRLAEDARNLFPAEKTVERRQADELLATWHDDVKQKAKPRALAGARDRR